jgi:hypothetical protein
MKSIEEELLKFAMEAGLDTPLDLADVSARLDGKKADFVLIAALVY